MSTEADQSPELHRLRWQCRRGMLELDLLLERFLDVGYRELTREEKDTFASLLGCSDQDIQAWVVGHAEVPDDRMRKLIEKIRAVGG